ncbi:AidB family quorum-quenching N-acyl homoserine lactonase [Acidocella sp.]|jgi:glyoxylase-like metal-dependent hydrolase (beta-lactamase superfamily II)|uniref:AidB family quorum-quenching N-acyl homoserine lactonase n=1 Tax=Acidocella sp. TaxID=50710 RepID=UPI002F42A1BA
MMHTGHRFGQYDIVPLLDGVFEAPADVLIHAAGDEARRRLIEKRGGKGIRVDVNCFVLRGPDGITLIDAGAADAFGPALGKARAALQEAGIRPEQIDRVLLTHIHGDHALGLFDGTAPWLPRAEILVPEVDLAFFTDPAARSAQPEGKRGPFDIAANLVRAYAGRLRPFPNGQVPGMPGIEALPLPGHTPGHTGYLLRGAEDSLLIWADTLHLQDEQTADPDIGLIFDTDPTTALRTRRALLEQVAQEGWLVAGSHITGFGRVRRAGAAFSFVTEG